MMEYSHCLTTVLCYGAFPVGPNGRGSLQSLLRDGVHIRKAGTPSPLDHNIYYELSEPRTVLV